MDKNLFDAGKVNRELADKKKKLNQENKQIMDELDRTVKMILNLKGYAIFVHNVLRETKLMKFKSDINILDNRGFDTIEIAHKDRDVEKLNEALIHEFSYIERQGVKDYPYFLNDHFRMIQEFMELEEKILKLMQSKQNFEKETEIIVIENRASLKEFESREKQVRREYEKLQSEKYKEVKISKDLKISLESEKGNEEIMMMLRDLYYICVHGEDYDYVMSHKRIKKKFNMDVREELTDKLKKIEFDVIDYIERLDKISKEDETEYKKVVHLRKEHIRNKKVTDQKNRGIALDIFRKKRAEERMHRIVVKGRNTLEHILAGREEKKKKNYMNTSKEGGEINMLFYDNSDL